MLVYPVIKMNENLFLKRMWFLLLLLCFQCCGRAQYSDVDVFKQMNPSQQKNNSLDSLKKVLITSREDTGKVLLLVYVSNIYMWSYPDRSLAYSFKGLQLAQKIHFNHGIIKAYHAIGESLTVKGNFSKALEIELKASQLGEQVNDPAQVSLSIFWLGLVYLESGESQKELDCVHKLTIENEVFRHNQELIFTHMGTAYFNLNKLDSAL